jgi:hypothetical protein
MYTQPAYTRGAPRFCRTCKKVQVGTRKRVCPDCDKTRITDRYAKGRRLIIEAKSKPCADCGKSYHYCVMDFDHVRGEKTGSIAKMAMQSHKILLDEIAKCDVVCANCHRLRTQFRGGSLKPQIVL